MGAMDHSEVRELLEDAAIEPGGLERLMAGDTASASIVAGHLAGCPDCAAELERLRRSVGLIRPALATVPPAELRERTLAYVAAVGRPRGAAADLEPTLPEGVPALTIVEPAAAGGFRAVSSGSGRRIARPGLATLTALAAALIVAVTGTALVVNRVHEDGTQAQTAEIEALGEVTRWTLRVDSQPDVHRVALTGATNATATGSLVFSPSTTELVVVADGLAPVAPGQEYRCWVEVDGKRSSIGRMFFGGDLAYWVGDVPTAAALAAPGARFGVSLVERGAPDAPGSPVLVSPS